MFLHDFSAIVSAIEQGVTKNSPKHLIDLARSVGRVGTRTAADFIEVVGIVIVMIQADLFDDMATASADDDSAEAIGTKVQRKGHSILLDKRALLEAGERATRGDLFGTLFQVEGDWYARADGMHGVLLPLLLSLQAKLAAVHNRGYRIVGTIEYGPQSYPIAILVEHLVPQPEH